MKISQTPFKNHENQSTNIKKTIKLKHTPIKNYENQKSFTNNSKQALTLQNR